MKTNGSTQVRKPAAVHGRMPFSIRYRNRTHEKSAKVCAEYVL
jgi:hypothetical protein